MLLNISAFFVNLNKLNDFLWGWLLLILILICGIYLSVKTRFVQIFHLRDALKSIFTKEASDSSNISSFSALCTSLAATIGTGNIVGVATAISAGGPGALLWMEVAAFFGMATKYAEGLLAVKYRTVKPDGSFFGGPFTYIEKGIGKKWRWLGKLFAIFGVLAGLLGIGTFTQVNSITDSVKSMLKISEKSSFPLIIISIALSTLVGLIIIGGAKRIAKVSEFVVPFMAVSYVAFTLLILILNINALPSAFKLIIKSAFSTNALGGAIAGISIKKVMQMGIGRGIFSNESGLGSAPIASACAKTDQPVRQGLVTMTGTFFDTIMICTMTGLSIVVTGAWNPEITKKVLQGFSVTAYAWNAGLSAIFDGGIPLALLSLSLIFFAFTSIVGWSFYSERCLAYLTESPKAIKIFRIIYILAVAAGPFIKNSEVWLLADIFNALMALPNLFALLLLSDVIAKDTENFFCRKNK